MDNAIGRNVKALREAAGLSQAELARRMRTAGFVAFDYQQTVGKIESGRRDVKLDEGMALAKVLGVTPDTLLSSQVPTSEIALLGAMAAIDALEPAARDAITALTALSVAAAQLVEQADRLEAAFAADGLLERMGGRVMPLRAYAQEVAAVAESALRGIDLIAKNSKEVFR